MTEHSLCGILSKSGRDCERPVPPGRPFNVCTKHLSDISEYLREARAINAGRRLHRTTCPGCEQTVDLVVDWETRTAACEECGHVTAGIKPTQFVVPSTFTNYQADVVYYIRFGCRIKIGTTKSLQNRLQSLPHDEVLATEVGGRDVEQARHKQFAATRVTPRGEWFHPSAELISHINTLRETPLTAVDLAA